MMNRIIMGVLVFSTVCVFCGSVLCAEENVLRFNIPEQGFPPYLLSNPPSGIMYDVMMEISARLGYGVKVVHIPAKRIELWIQDGKVDVQATAPAFQDNPEQFIFTDPVLSIRGVIFSRKGDPFHYRTAEDLFGLTIGTIRGYGYPSLDSYIDQGKIIRDDTRDELATLKKLAMGRVDVGVITEFVGRWILKKNPSLQDKFNISTVAVDDTPLSFMMNKKWKPFVTKFNKELSSLKENGELERIISKYIEVKNLSN